jgi:CRP-like cAMP-binding protein
MGPFIPTSTNNQILSRLSPDECGRLGPHLVYVDLPLGKVLLNPGELIDFLLFPEFSVASVVGSDDAGHCAEIGLIGGEGVVGVEVLLGPKRAVHLVNIQLPGSGYRLSTAEALREFSLGGSFQSHVLRYLHVLMTQVSSTAMCNALHGLDERLARWLLMCHDRFDGEKLPMTQEFLALMAGVGRPSVSIAAHGMQSDGLITYSRGKITINDRAGLIDRACDCYEAVTACQKAHANSISILDSVSVDPVKAGKAGLFSVIGTSVKADH